MKKLLLAFTFFVLTLSVNATTYYVATTGNDSNPGTIGSPFLTIGKLNTVLVAGDIAYVRGGTYESPSGNAASVHFNLTGLNGSSGSPIIIQAYPGETVIFSAATITPSAANPILFQLDNSDYVTLKGFIIRQLLQKADGSGVSTGFNIETTDHCTIENCNVYNIGGRGFSIGSDNTNTYILNVDSHNNGDGLSAWDFGDGFACTGGNTSTGMTFEGCRAWMNGDDGWDFFEWGGDLVTLKNCWSFWNSVKPWGASGTQPSLEGMTPANPSLWSTANDPSHTYLTSTTSGEGFKLGGCNAPGCPAAAPTTTKKFLQNCFAFENCGTGFTSNMLVAYTHRMSMLNCTSYNNGNDGFGFGNGKCVGMYMIFKNCVSWSNNDLQTGGDIDYDGLNTGSLTDYWGTWYDENFGNLKGTIGTVTSSDFLSIVSATGNGTGVVSARQSNGNLPVITYGRLAPGSRLIGVGTDVGIPYTGTAPDLGAFEYGGDIVLPIKARFLLTNVNNSLFQWESLDEDNIAYWAIEESDDYGLTWHGFKNVEAYGSPHQYYVK